MANILISYGDSNFSNSLDRLKEQAKELNLFDEIKTYTPKDIPIYIKSSPLFAFEKGGGYWIWKPYIIYHTLKKCQLGDIVYYVDAGCSINKNSKEWNSFQCNLQHYNAIFFQYRSNINYGWESFCQNIINNKTAIKHWAKPSTLEYFIKRFKDNGFLEYSKIMGGFCIIKKTSKSLQVLEEWYKIYLFKPELIIDPWGEELLNIPETYNAHRHDQSILTPLIYYYKETDEILVLPETSESQKDLAAVSATRYRCKKNSIIGENTPFIAKIKTYIYFFIYKRIIKK